MVLVRKALPEDIEIISRLFRNTIKTVNACDYEPQQLRIWSSKYEDKVWWKDRIRTDFFLVAEKENRILGFCSINSEGVLGLMYVHKDYQGNGVGTLLMNELVRYSIKLNIREIVSDVSITAKPFFEKMGFKNTGRQKKVLEGIEFYNIRMSKKIFIHT